MPVYLQSTSPIFVIVDSPDPRQQKIIKAFFNGFDLSNPPIEVKGSTTEDGVQLTLPNNMDLADGVQLLSKILGITQWMGEICSAAKIPEK